MIYIDRPRSYNHKRKRYSHLIADSIDELHSFASNNGIKRHWFHKDHYDIREEEFQRLVDCGAKIISAKELAKLRKK